MLVLRPSPRSARALHLRLLGATLTGALLLASLPAQAAMAPSPAEIERIYSEGEKKNSDKDFKGAAQSWTRLMVLLPEEGANQATRETLLINVLDAHINAYNRLPSPDGKKDITHLQEGKKTYELYLQQYNAVYPDRAISAAVQQKADELDAALAKAENDGKGPAVVTGPDVVDDKDKDKKTDDDKDKDIAPIVLPPENNGTGLIVGGAVAAGLGLGALGLLIAGAVSAPKAEKDYENAQNLARGVCNVYPDPCTGLTMQEQTALDGYDADINDADKRGRTANTLTIVGAVLTPVLLGAGAAMLAIGIKRNRQSRSARGPVSMSPAFGRGFSGFVLRGKF
jgi:hypothetical protein